jgi:hypothetical protein
MYKIGLSSYELPDASLEKIKELGWKWERVKVGDALRSHIDECLGKEYKNPSSMRADAPNAFSCSSLISYLFVFAGVWMPSLSIDKYAFARPIAKEELQFGDLIFSNTHNGTIRYETVEYKKGTQVPQGIDHVGLYIGDNKVLHATKRLGKVVVESLDEVEKFAETIGFGRVADQDEERIVVTVPSEREDIKNKEALLSFLSENYLITAA